jgi:hypothetical protein
MKLNKNIAISETGLLFNPITGESFTVNPIGVEVLNLMKEDKSSGEISRIILEKYSTDPLTFEKDYQDFMGMLQHYKLIDHHETPQT